MVETNNIGTFEKGTLYWVTGLSGAGKTTFGGILYEKLRSKNDNIVFLDGDEVRAGICDDLGYDFEDRKKCALRYSKLAELIVNQGFDVIFCTISMFDEVRLRNREVIKKYVEIYMKTSSEVLFQRDQKRLYSNSESEKKLVGVDIVAEEPKNPDFVIESNDISELYEYAEQIVNKRR